MEDNFSLKEFMIDLKNELVDDGIDLRTTPVIFKWRYPEQPEFLYSLMIIDEPEEMSAYEFDAPDTMQ